MTPSRPAPPRSSRLRAAAVASTLALVTAACGGTGGDDDAAAADVGRQLAGPRLVVTTDEGILVLERESLETVATLPSEGFVRVNPAGDERHAFVSTSEGFQLLDTGVEVEVHGDHSHYAVAGDPALGETFEAPEPGHVTVHDGRTLLFSDGAGTVQELGLFGTTLVTGDNVLTIVGNGKIFSDTIQNFSALPVRRVDRTAQLASSVDPMEAVERFRDAVAKIPNVATSPAPDVRLLEVTLVGPVIAIRPYTHTDHYWQVFFDTNEAIVRVCREAGWPAPMPSQVVRQG